MLFHGGVPGLCGGDVIRPGESRNHHAGCPICAAREAGDRSGIDPANHVDGVVYLTEDLEYARYYASLFGRGDLYLVEPIGGLTRSLEDLFPSFTCESARVLSVVERGVLLLMRQRREFFVRWASLEGIGRKQALSEFKRMVKAARKGAA